MAFTVTQYQKWHDEGIRAAAFGAVLGFLLVFALGIAFPLGLVYMALGAFTFWLIYRYAIERVPLMCPSCKKHIDGWICHHCDTENKSHLFSKCKQCHIENKGYRCRCGWSTGDTPAHDPKIPAQVIEEEAKPQPETVALLEYEASLTERMAKKMMELKHHADTQREIARMKAKEIAELKKMLEKGEIDEKTFERLEDEIKFYK